ncbi:unnamed protein product [Cladocopium goreaui]|uniref:Uncharacterized protein n=1 Tax=Cladocopium goreaui TaxID=2562237 RepID=A0A9P1DI07_9DINO|nr:unnamed protein product [Cladocopium goreaui]
MTGSRFLVASLMPAWLVASVINAVITEMIFQLKVLEVAGAIGARGARGGVVLGALWNQGW